MEDVDTKGVEKKNSLVSPFTYTVILNSKFEYKKHRHTLRLMDPLIRDFDEVEV